jgi:hypothetical protein
VDFELHLERNDGTEYVERFTRPSLDEAWAYAASFILTGEYKCVQKMLNLSVVNKHPLRVARS